jgi:opacity protein-like surface antigen
MKRRLTVTSAILTWFLLVSSPVFALKDSPISVGPKLGLNLSDLSGDVEEATDSGSDMKTGFCGGAFLAWAISDWFTLQPEFLYSQKGADAKDYDGTISLNYIEIPLLAMLTIPMEGRFTPNVFVGPSFAFNIKAEASSGGASLDIKDEISSTDIGIALGAGVKVGEIGPGAITADIRYTMGLTNVLDNELADLADVSVKNRVFCFMVGYAF